MELVDANTKNYLFLTMSQYNDQDKLVRARVSMRRDQAFWQGGNSFIACESFRISAAPSQGGLYYTILPGDFYIGAVNRETTPEDAVAFEPLVRSGRTLEASSINNPSTITHDQILTMDVNMCTSNVPQKGDSIVESDPAVVLPIVGELWNDHGIQKGQQIRMICYNNNSPVNLTGVVQNSPLMNITGRGGGPDELFYPVTGDWDYDEDWPGDGPDVAMLSGAYVQAELDIKNIGIPGLASTVDITGEITSMLGEQCFLEITRGADENTNSVPVPLRQPGMEFMGPAYIEVDGIDIWNKNAAGQNTSLKHKIYWDHSGKLAVGDDVYVIIPASGAIRAHTQHGRVTKINSDFVVHYNGTGAHGPVRGVSITGGMWRLTPAYRNWLNDHNNSWGIDNSGQPATADDALENMWNIKFPWVLTHTNVHVPDNIQVNLQVKVDQSNSTASMNAFNAALPITEFQVRKGNDRTLNRIEHRACPHGEQKYIYTPNELYWTFNNPQGDTNVDGTQAAATPYLLQTHENGGFKVVWDGKFSDFYMTASMHEALGLNDYFEYNYTKRGDSQSNWDMCLQKPLTTIQLYDNTYQSSIIHLPGPQVYIKGSNPLTPVDAASIALGTTVVTADSVTEYILVSKQVITDTEEKNEVVKVYPTSTFDSDGNEVLNWKSLPESIMGNTQQVSVESFGTFSGINIVIPNLPFQPMLGTASDDRILASLRLPFQYGTENNTSGVVNMTDFSYYGDLLFNSDSSRSYLRITTDQQIYDCDVEARLIRRDGGMEILYLPYLGQFEIKLRFLQTQ